MQILGLASDVPALLRIPFRVELTKQFKTLC
jgi:hypothetical protein